MGIINHFSQGNQDDYDSPYNNSYGNPYDSAKHFTQTDLDLSEAKQLLDEARTALVKIGLKSFRYKTIRKINKFLENE